MVYNNYYKIKYTKAEVISIIKSLCVLLIPLLLICLFLPDLEPVEDVEKKCYRTCRFQIVESIPEHLSYSGNSSSISTFNAWMKLINITENELFIAAYKSSLQKKHVLSEYKNINEKNQGDLVFEALLQSGKKPGIDIRIVENYPPKDRGDNIDGRILENHQAAQRKSLDLFQMIGRGKMHSKFLVSDTKHLYIGSANLDWRSLTQKFEVGVLIENCECLAQDMRNIFDTYWFLPKIDTKKETKYNMKNPLRIRIGEESSNIYIASSPIQLNHQKRTWDLDAIISEIDNAKEFLDINVMDYFPLLIYRKPQKYFSSIDNAIRRAIIRGVKIQILSSALHYPELGLRFLKSLQALDSINNSTNIAIKIITIPKYQSNSLISRERRSHIKFLVSERSVIIGTSNWSGDYFVAGTTGAAVVIQQFGSKRVLVQKMKKMFERDWNGPYSHALDDYFNNCIARKSALYCEIRKT